MNNLLTFDKVCGGLTIKFSGDNLTMQWKSYNAYAYKI